MPIAYWKKNIKLKAGQKVQIGNATCTVDHINGDNAFLEHPGGEHLWHSFQEIQKDNPDLNLVNAIEAESS